MTTYLTMADALMMHKVLVKRYGGANGLRDAGALEAALFRPQSGYYNDVIEEAAALIESLAINHPFVDGNKRIAFACCDVFLRMNGYEITKTSREIYRDMITMFESGSFNMEKLTPWLKSMVKQTSV